MTNCEFKLHGTPFLTNDPLDFTLKNITFAYDYTPGGFVLVIDCNYPEARLSAEIVLKNNTIKFDDERKVDMVNSYITYTGPGNLTVTDCHASIHSDLTTDRSTFWFTLESRC